MNLEPEPSELRRLFEELCAIPMPQALATDPALANLKLEIVDPVVDVLRGKPFTAAMETKLRKDCERMEAEVIHLTCAASKAYLRKTLDLAEFALRRSM